MKKILVLFVIILSLGFNNTFSQIKPLNKPNPNEAPIFADPIAKDSLRLLCDVRVWFVEPLHEGMKKVCVKSIEVLRMYAVPLRSVAKPPYVFYLSKDDTVRSTEYQDLWDRYSQYILPLYKKRSYKELTQSSWHEGDNRLIFTNIFWLVPEKKIDPSADN